MSNGMFSLFCKLLLQPMYHHKHCFEDTKPNCKKVEAEKKTSVVIVANLAGSMMSKLYLFNSVLINNVLYAS